MLIHCLKHARTDALGRQVDTDAPFGGYPSFGWEAVETSNGKIAADRGKNTTRKIEWMKNKYPCDAWEDGVEHYLCWSTAAPSYRPYTCDRPT
eukprot:scaffold2520_cov135-Skeletonema_menzelii.AAC.1